MNGKFTDLPALARDCLAWREAGKRIVWTNGCFDLVHAGHVKSLQAARDLGDVLVVGLNSDRSAKALKGGDRPLCRQEDRAAVLAAMACVDRIVVFDGERCVPELEAVKPHVWAKAGDYSPGSLDPGEKAAVAANGGEIRFTPLVEGLSTSLILKKARRSDPEKVTNAAFGVLRDGRGRILMVATRYADGVRWGFPGGGQNRDESAPEAAVREMREETGISARIRRHAGVIERMEPSWGLHLLINMFEFEAENPADLEREDFAPNPAEDVEAVEWFDAERLRSEPGWVLGRKLWLRYIGDPEHWPSYVFMGAGEE